MNRGRFWREVAVEDGEIRLDGRLLKTPQRATLRCPNERLANAVADEWRAVESIIDPRTMPMTGLLNAVIDRIEPDVPAFTAHLARYALGDLLCYRADHPVELVIAQAATWNPPLDWARRRYDIDFVVTNSILHVDQPAETMRRLAEAVAAYSAFELAGLSPLVTLSGSLVLALALAEGHLTEQACWEAAELDELWQADHWGEDSLATAAREDKHRDFRAAARFLALLA